MHKKECVAMILAGGQGSRLESLTKNIAKPAVPFGGKYRIIDFTLSNCRNSGIDTIGVLTQYQPLTLHSYIGNGGSWDLDCSGGGVYVLPPYAREKGADWYKGTADAIYQNLNFIEMMNPQYVLILSGDHIYNMDYSMMLDYHKEKKADVTISVVEVPWKDATRFGIMNTSDSGRITEFVEKPREPKSNLASMGIYIFNWRLLRKSLEEDCRNLSSNHDFGKNVIPRLLAEGWRLFAHYFTGYWKDVGTIESFWEANMDLLDDRPKLNLHDPEWHVYSVNQVRPPHYVAATAKISQSIISDGCTVFGDVERSVVFPGVHIAEGVKVKDSIIMPYANIGAHAEVFRSIVGSGCRIEAGAIVGCFDKEIFVVDENTIVAGSGSLTGNYGAVKQRQVV
jgi:glucose-1-phosphate adenylyltransferase